MGQPKERKIQVEIETKYQNQTEMIKLIIADDHPIFIDGLKTILEPAPEICIVGEALNGIQLLKLLKTKKADIVLLDINMPKMDGLEAAQHIKQQHSNVKIIMLTQFGDKGFVKKCVDIGVDGYLLKDSDQKELIEAIKVVYKNGTYFKINTGKQNSKGLEIESIQLSNREKQVLKLLTEDKRCKEIAKELYLKNTTVRTYRNRLMIKAGVSTIAGLIHWADNNGLI